MERAQGELLAVAARMVVEDGLEYGAAKRRAAKQIGVRGALPDNDELEAAVREHIELFCADTQPAELARLRQLALVWMGRMERFRPHLTGAVWQGTATRHSDVYIDLFCDDPKEAEIALIDHGVDYQPGAVGAGAASVEALSIGTRCEALGSVVGVHLLLHDYDGLRGALKPDAQGRSPRGSIDAVRKLVMETQHA